MEYEESEFLQLSGLQHFAFCRRQWALIHIEHIWAENSRTAEGRLLHEKAHDRYLTESRGNLLISRSMPVFSRVLGLSGECDIVEFRPTEEPGGIPIRGHSGNYTVYPMEYKRGSPKAGDCDALQLAAQAMCLEEMLCCRIAEGALFYFEIRRRVPVRLTEQLRQKVTETAAEMHQDYDRRYLPRPKQTKSCHACSLKDECLPKLGKLQAKAYNRLYLGEADADKEEG